MEDVMGIGNSFNLKSENKPLGCKMSAQSTQTSGWVCNKVVCPSYGKWYCPFSW